MPNDITWDETSESPPQLPLSPYDRARMQGVGPGVGATTGPAAPETILPMYASLMQPAVRLPRLTPPSTLGKVLAAPVNLAESAVEGITSPVGAATLPLFGSAAGRTAMGALGMAGGVQQMVQAKDPGEFTQGALQTALSPLLFRKGPVAPVGTVAQPERLPVLPESIRQQLQARVQQNTIDEATKQLGPEVVERLRTQTRARSTKAHAAGVRAGPKAENPYVEGSLESKAFKLGQSTHTNTETEVTRVTQDGRLAIFDPKTKKFIRYAD